MAVNSIVGLQWGDEGKGKLTDLLSQDAEVIVRYQGGNNAGHSIKFNDKCYSLRIIPSGIFNGNAEVVIANGVVMNPKILLEEIKMLEEEGISTDRIKISDRVNIIFPYHEEMDKLIDDQKYVEKVGTTKKGIGPCYGDKIERVGIRMCELYDADLFREKLRYNIDSKNDIFRMYGYKEFDFEQIFEEYQEYAEQLKNYMTDTSLFLTKAINGGKKVLFEGAQGVMLDLEFGTYPYVTSSSPASTSIPINSGINSRYIDKNIGVVKAYTSRVGEGSFPTEISGAAAEHIIERGHEFGTVTGRKRRVGWLDLVQLKYAIRVSAIDKIALMLLDVLEGLDEIQVCVGYKLNGNKIETLPALESDYQRVEPIYKKFKGFDKSSSGVRKFDDLCENAKEYVKFIEEELGREVVIVSIGKDRTETIIRDVI